MIVTQDMIDAAYHEGKCAYHRWFGLHGPTFKPHYKSRPENPFTDSTLNEAWRRGWNKDVRRLIAPKPWPNWKNVG